MSNLDVETWFTNRVFGHEPMDAADNIASAKGRVAERFPHLVELPVLEGPMSPHLIFNETKQPWTSFYSRSEKVIVFAFSDIKDAVEFRLKL